MKAPRWTLDEAAAPVDLAALDLFALPANEVPRPGCEGWVDPIDPRDLGPLSDDVNSEAGEP